MVVGVLASPKHRSHLSEIRNDTSIAGIGLVPVGQLEVVAEDFAEHAFKVGIGIVDAPHHRIGRDPLVDGRNFPFKVKQGSCGAGQRAMNSAPSALATEFGSFVLPNPGSGHLVS